MSRKINTNTIQEDMKCVEEMEKQISKMFTDEDMISFANYIDSIPHSERNPSDTTLFLRKWLKERNKR